MSPISRGPAPRLVFLSWHINKVSIYLSTTLVYTSWRRLYLSFLAIPGGYSEWSQWEQCNVSCGGGIQRRYRRCTNPPPSDGGSTCIEQNLGPAEEIQQCNRQNCRKCRSCLKRKVLNAWILWNRKIFQEANDEVRKVGGLFTVLISKKYNGVMKPSALLNDCPIWWSAVFEPS